MRENWQTQFQKMAMARLLQLPWMRERNDAHRMNRARGGGEGLYLDSKEEYHKNNQYKI
jgi:hypothetical protein